MNKLGDEVCPGWFVQGVDSNTLSVFSSRYILPGEAAVFNLMVKNPSTDGQYSLAGTVTETSGMSKSQNTTPIMITSKYSRSISAKIRYEPNNCSERSAKSILIADIWLDKDNPPWCRVNDVCLQLPGFVFLDNIGKVISGWQVTDVGTGTIRLQDVSGVEAGLAPVLFSFNVKNPETTGSYIGTLYGTDTTESPVTRQLPSLTVNEISPRAYSLTSKFAADYSSEAYAGTKIEINLKNNNIKPWNNVQQVSISMGNMGCVPIFGPWTVVGSSAGRWILAPNKILGGKEIAGGGSLTVAFEVKTGEAGNKQIELIAAEVTGILTTITTTIKVENQKPRNYQLFAQFPSNRCPEADAESLLTLTVSNYSGYNYSKIKEVEFLSGDFVVLNKTGDELSAGWQVIEVGSNSLRLTGAEPILNNTNRQFNLAIKNPSKASTCNIIARCKETTEIIGTATANIEIQEKLPRATGVDVQFAPGYSGEQDAKSRLIIGITNTSGLDYSRIKQVRINSDDFIILDGKDDWQDKGNGWVIIGTETNAVIYEPNSSLAGRMIGKDEGIRLELGVRNPGADKSIGVLNLGLVEESGVKYSTTGSVTLQTNSQRDYRLESELIESREAGAISRLKLRIINNGTMDWTSINRLVICPGSWTVFADMGKDIGSGYGLIGTNTEAITYEPIELLGGKPIYPKGSATIYLAIKNPDAVGSFTLKVRLEDTSNAATTISSEINIKGTLSRNYAVSAMIPDDESNEISARSIVSLTISNLNQEEFMQVSGIVVDLGSQFVVLDQAEDIGFGWRLVNRAGNRLYLAPTTGMKGIVTLASVRLALSVLLPDTAGSWTVKITLQEKTGFEYTYSQVITVAGINKREYPADFRVMPNTVRHDSCL
ncbi:hypothetical protein HY792_06790 [Candidatus Desantisbacteria bacterium]|nr:hypothetical protein [Candidatus Desantisbacteria bacterium]